jgi:hypothetical protein
MKTFVVRLWAEVEPAAGKRDPLRGIVEHVGSGCSTPFANESELLAFLRQAEPAEPVIHPSPANPIPATGGRP